MAKDLLPTLLEAQSEDSDQVDPDDNVILIENNGDDFLQKVEEIHKIVHHIQERIEEVKQLHTTILLSPQSEEAIQQQLEDVMYDIKTYANNVRNRIKGIEQTIAELEDEPRKSVAELRIRKIQHFTLTKVFNNVMTEYNQAQLDYRERCKKRIIRQLEITGRETTNEELEDMLEEGNPAIFTMQGIIVETDEAKLALDDIEARHADIMKLETCIRELHDMFMDMAMLIERQGEMINNIEYVVQNAKDHVQEGREELTIAVDYFTKAQRKRLILIAIAIVVIIIVFLLIFV